ASVSLQGGSPTAGVSYAWNGPEGFSSIAQNPSVSVSGTYTLTVTDPVNGCTSTAQVLVEENTTAPGATAVVSGLLTCTVTSVSLQGSSPTAGVSYAWNGPEGFSSIAQNPSVSLSGTYTLTVTDPVNGCTSTAQVLVEENTTAPGATASVSGLLTCTVASVSLQGGSPTVGVSYAWIGPEGFTSIAQNPSVSVAGLYTLAVTNPQNGCISEASVEVVKNVVVPDLTAADGQHTCTNIAEGGLVLEANSTIASAQYSWTVPPGTEIFFPDTNVRNLTVPFSFIIGEFTVTLTDPATGCTNSKTVNVTDNTALPECNIVLETDNTLRVGTIENGIYEWVLGNPDWQITGGQGTSVITFSPGPVGSIALFSISITNSANGCTESCSIELENTGSGVVTTAGAAPLSRSTSQPSSLEATWDESSIFDTPISASLGVYPNPFQKAAKLFFSVPEATEVSVELYSTYGMMVQPLFAGKVEANRNYELDLYSANLTTGLYLCRLIYGKNIIEEKVMIR
ncbi:MAG: T9SS type A sorting domain-containing protein, partial [Cytophagales bacterium]|nr:T9SS type A sorting domain-containing protein [Cytophagales bacterium]